MLYCSMRLIITPCPIISLKNKFSCSLHDNFIANIKHLHNNRRWIYIFGSVVRRWKRPDGVERPLCPTCGRREISFCHERSRVIIFLLIIRLENFNKAALWLANECPHTTLLRKKPLNTKWLPLPATVAAILITLPGCVLHKCYFVRTNFCFACFYRWETNCS